MVLMPQFSLCQYYDIGYNTNYTLIQNLNFSDTKSNIVEFQLNSNKVIKKVFNQNQELVEELVFIDQILISGVEYFINKEFPFLDTPRNFIIKELEHVVSDYKNIKFSPSLIKYLPNFQKGVFRVRLYTLNDQTFYILNTGFGNKIYFQYKDTIID